MRAVPPITRIVSDSDSGALPMTDPLMISMTIFAVVLIILGGYIAHKTDYKR